MKKTNLFYILITTILCVSCSSDDDSSNTNADSINPPNWIHGTWSGSTNTQSGFKFTPDDFITIVINTETSWKEQIKFTNNADVNTNVNETINENEYKIDITVRSNTISYYFEKKSDNIIELTNDPLGELSESLLIKQ
ncbi:hypothetical protein ES677_05240 [Bizionia gelidisalsuginis]|uniref:Uncharacterized protein n=2 Tax=Bizionia TaxID=283785 RepID=A0A8H2QL15_9FLAO|nr:MULTISPECIES: hypothetical protein [Bizionia]TYB73033.1 hypothetical protein ES676_09760 [Bizionia saleffrena]TYC14785.1 hypothetical protein ES677_05240 [Bizionia gelidisalsuginis]